ncbi:hypothetical protein SAMN02745248_00729 [Hathewaya proteolytica DSM 3090]|uniref:Polymerase/histidinol phosphatase N-terminal domain-containing protein n=1 Tax=Hathewaya proteolytica DSM 3090 TaxID=1121331 RepID=A0A1M6LEB2_9CLOT|nr:PHP domain-containing protein [Hathewaya proteolytica]SHJ69551.1 hypothetical protein SAMN02745248_00729 [Hathewaya proteolytica DSM 3090]
MIKADLHTHSNFSDGILSPEDLILKASNCGLQIISITDHDTMKYGRTLIDFAKENGVTLIPGIELTTLHKGGNIHLLGYFKDDSYTDSIFQDNLYFLQTKRMERAKKMVDNLKEFYNIIIDFQHLIHSSNSLIARPHIAKAIIEAGYNYTFTELFDSVLSKKSKAYIPNFGLTLEEGIQLLHKYNAITVIAHPTLMRSNSIEDLMDMPFQGIEAIYPQNKPLETEKFIALAEAHNKLYTAGSDYHGINGDIKHGAMGDYTLTGSALERFLQCLNAKV